MSIFTFSRAKKIIVKSQQSEAVLERLRSYLDENREDPIKILSGMWQDESEAITYQELREALLSDEQMAELLETWSLDYSYMVTNKFKTVWENAIKYAASLEPLLQGKDFVLDMTSFYVTDWVERRGAAFVTALADAQKDAIQVFLTNNVMDGHSVDELAKLIRPCIGLTKQQAAANKNYYDHVKATLQKDHPKMKKDTIERKAHEASLKYAEKQHRYRADTIAQTEMAYAYNNGADIGIRQAQADGLMGIVKKEWSTSLDDNVCDICRALEGVQVDMDDEFDFKGRALYAGQKRLPPAHPRCACAVKYIEIEPPAFERK